MVSGNKPESPQQDIDLVALAATLVQNRSCFLAVFLIVFLVGAAYAWLAPAKYEHVSLIQVANKFGDGERQPLEPKAATLALISNQWLPELQSQHLAETGDELPFDIRVESPQESVLIELVSIGVEKHETLIKETHQYLLEKTAKHLSQVVDDTETQLRREVQSIETLVNTLDDQRNSAEALAALLPQKYRLERDLRSLRDAELLVVARQGHEKVSPERLFILVGSGIAGLVLGIVAALFVRFACTVRNQLHDGQR